MKSCSISPEFENYVNDKVASGRYNPASEVLRESLKLLQDHDQLQRIRRDELRREIMFGVDQIRRGEGIKVKNSELGEFYENIKKEGRARLAKKDER